MGKQNGVNGATAPEAVSELTSAIAEFSGIKKNVERLDQQVGELKAQEAAMLERGRELAAKIRELLNLGGKGSRKPASANTAPRRPRGERATEALRLLYDGEVYSTQFFAEEFGGTVGAAYQVLKKLADKGLVSRPAEGKWQATESGKQAAAEL